MDMVTMREGERMWDPAMATYGPKVTKDHPLPEYKTPPYRNHHPQLPPMQ